MIVFVLACLRECARLLNMCLCVMCGRLCDVVCIAFVCFVVCLLDLLLKPLCLLFVEYRVVLHGLLVCVLLVFVCVCIMFNVFVFLCV